MSDRPVVLCAASKFERNGVCRSSNFANRTDFIPDAIPSLGEPVMLFKAGRLPALLRYCVMALSFGGSLQATAIADSYLEHVKPLFKERCLACHGSLKQEGGLRLDTGAAIRAGADSGAIVNLQQPADSVLLQRLTASDESERMPPEGSPLTKEQIAAIGTWIRLGAKSPADETPEPSPEDHWAFQTPVRPVVPEHPGSTFVWNEVDQFLAARWQAAGMQPVQDAAPAIRLRRLYLDLTGLPPSPQQINAFVNDPSPIAWTSTVDRLLSSAAYGERWGRHWMDIWRYSDWYGRRQNQDVRNSAPQIWRWRDWIVTSLNEDKSYARMIQEMLAADEIAAADDAAWPATGYLVRNYYSLNPNEWMRHNVEYTGKAFLGLTFNCAHCHDHKYDPIAHEDYFRFRAFFEPLGIRHDRVVGEPEPPLFEPYLYSGSRKVVKLGMVRTFDESFDAVTQFYTGGDERNVVPEHSPIRPGVPSFLDVALPSIQKVQLPVVAWYPGARSAIQQAVLAEARQAVNEAQQQLAAVDSVAAHPGLASDPIKHARKQLQAAIRQSDQQSQSGALQGQQSLLMDASTGGRLVLHQRVDSLQTLSDGATISFKCLLLQDGHFNFQLARDAQRRLTALYLGFKNGEVRAYQPGGFTEAKLANYVPTSDAEWTPATFQVKLVLRPKADVAELTIKNLRDNALLVGAQAIALNGWNGPANVNQPLTFDCQTGTRVVVDDVRLQSSTATLLTDFEAPEFSEGQPIAGRLHWTRHTLSSGAADCWVSSTAINQRLLIARQKLRQIYATFVSQQNASTLAMLKLQAAKARLAATEATIAADDAQKAAAASDVVKDRASAAVSSQMKAEIAKQKVAAVQAIAGEKPEPNAAAALSSALNSLIDAEAAACAANVNGTTDYVRFSPVTHKTSTGRRTALAKWITHPQHPLTARVAVNHIWSRHFRQPLVPTVFDFGRNGQPPSHPQLLDWLAVHFVESGWSMKSLHRLIVTSHAYSLSSNRADKAAGVQKDKANQLLCHFPTGRMEAEVVRDSLLQICGKLDRTAGGPPLTNDQAMTTFRRTLYYERFPEDGGADPLTAAFDAPDPLECFRRTETIVPQQALALSNSPLVHLAAENLAKRLAAELTEDRIVEQVFLSVLNRQPTQSETELASRFLQEQRLQIADELQAKTSFIRAMFNHNDFVTVR